MRLWGEDFRKRNDRHFIWTGHAFLNIGTQNRLLNVQTNSGKEGTRAGGWAQGKVQVGIVFVRTNDKRAGRCSSERARRELLFTRTGVRRKEGETGKGLEKCEEGMGSVL